MLNWFSRLLLLINALLLPNFVVEKLINKIDKQENKTLVISRYLLK